MTWGLSNAKTIDPFQFKDKYENITVSLAGILPTGYDPSRSYHVLIAEPGDGEKLLNGSTPSAVSNLLNKGGQAGCEFLKAKEYNGILVTFIVPFQPSELKGQPLKGRLLSQVVEQCKLRYKVSRVSMTGLSSGGADVWQYISAFPNSLYAAVPIACWQYYQTSALNKAVATGGTKIWQIQNSNDGTIGNGSDENLSYFMNELVKLGLDGKMTVLNRSGHDTWDPVYKNEKVPVLSGTLNTGKLSPLPDDIWAFLFGTEGTASQVPDTVISQPPVVTPSNTFVCDSLQATVSYTSRNVINGYYHVCTVTQNFKVDSINYNWKANPVMNARKDSVFMNVYGRFKVAKSGTYTFRLNTDDGSNLWINSNKVISDWTNHGVRERSVSLILMEDVWNSIVVDYYEATYDASLKCEVEGPDLIKQVIKRVK